MGRVTARFAAWIIVYLFVSGAGYSQSVYLDQIDGAIGIDSIGAEVPITFHFRLASNDTTHQGIVNGFRIYSADGATWDTATAGFSQDVTDSMFGMQIIARRSLTGTAADTIALVAMIWQDGLGGLAPNRDQGLGSVTIGPIAAEHVGKTVCIDSTFFPPNNKWQWLPVNAAWDIIKPSWSGPHCYTVAAMPSCCEIRGDADDNGVGPDIQDLIYLNAYVNLGGPEPPCIEQADVDGNDVINIADVVYLQAYMFNNGPPPVPCE